VANGAADPAIPATTSDRESSFQRESRILVRCVFGVALVHALVGLAQGFDNSVLDMHGFRQSQTAISTYYLLHGGNWIAYETPVLGPNWSIPFEFPLYQWVVASFVWLTGMSLDAAGRVVSVACFLWSLWLVHACLDHFGLSRDRRLIFSSLILVSPLYLFWSRTFMIESLALLLGLAYLLCVIRYLRRPQAATLVAMALLGILAGVTKITTFFGFGLAASLLLLERWLRSPSEAVSTAESRWGAVRQRIRQHVGVSFGLFWAGAAVPLIATLAWTAYTDALKRTVPLAADFITSAALREWNFGTVSQRLSPTYWSDLVFTRMGTDIFGSRAGTSIALLVIAAACIRSREFRAPILACVALFLAVLLTFTNLHLVHNYYQYANAVFLLFALGFALVALMRDPHRLCALLGVAALLLLTVGAAYGYNQVLREVARSNFPPEPIVAQVRERVAPDDVILVYGRDWSSAIPYYAERRAIMDRSFRAVDDVVLQRSLALLGERRLGGVVSCGMRERSPAELDARLRALGFATVPVDVQRDCELYLPAESGLLQSSGTRSS